MNILFIIFSVKSNICLGLGEEKVSFKFFIQKSKFEAMFLKYLMIFSPLNHTAVLASAHLKNDKKTPPKKQTKKKQKQKKTKQKKNKQNKQTKKKPTTKNKKKKTTKKKKKKNKKKKTKKKKKKKNTPPPPKKNNNKTTTKTNNIISLSFSYIDDCFPTVYIKLWPLAWNQIWPDRDVQHVLFVCKNN